jgi:hypothetical protein
MPYLQGNHRAPGTERARGPPPQRSNRVRNYPELQYQPRGHYRSRDHHDADHRDTTSRGLDRNSESRRHHHGDNKVHYLANSNNRHHVQPGNPKPHNPVSSVIVSYHPNKMEIEGTQVEHL